MAELDALRYVGLYEEPAGSYQEDHSGTPGDFLAVPYREGSFSHAPNRANHNPQTGTQRKDHHDEQILGHKKGQVSIGMLLHSHGVDLDGTEAPPTSSDWALLRLMQATFGGSFATTDPGVQTEVIAGSTTTTAVEVTVGHGARFRAHGVIACQCTAGSSALTLREIADVTGDVITVKEAFPSAPVTGTPVRGGVTVHLTEDPDTSLQVLVEGRSATDGILYRGLQLTSGPGLELPIGEPGTITFALEGGGWDELGVSAQTIASYDHFGEFHLDPVDVHVPTFGDTTINAPCVSALSVELGIAFADMVCGKSENGVARKIRTRVDPVASGSFTTPRDPEWPDAYADKERRALFIQLGQLAGRAILVSFPTVQITNVQHAAASDGTAAHTVSWEARLDADGGTTEESYSAVRFHFV